jgi:DNA-binding Lrp family transcriptional regulator
VDDKWLAVLLGISRHQSYREMADDIGRSLGAVQNIINELERAGMVVKPEEKKARSAELTPLGKSVLVQNGLPVG